MICVMGVIEEELISITVISWKYFIEFKTNCFKQSFLKIPRTVRNLLIERKEDKN